MIPTSTPITTTKITEGSRAGSSVETHPSYGMISVSRITSNSNTILFGSDVAHPHVIRISIGTGAERTRKLSNDWYFAKNDHAVELWMSEAQYAQMITTPNRGTGVPCTLRQIDKETLPLPEAPPPVIERFTSEMDVTILNSLAQVQKALDEIRAMSEGRLASTKTNLREVQKTLEYARSEMTSNQEYIRRQAGERLEKMHADAVSGFEAHVNRAMALLGLDSTGQQALLSTGEPGDVEEK